MKVGTTFGGRLQYGVLYISYFLPCVLPTTFGGFLFKSQARRGSERPTCGLLLMAVDLKPFIQKKKTLTEE